MDALNKMKFLVQEAQEGTTLSDNDIRFVFSVYNNLTPNQTKRLPKYVKVYLRENYTRYDAML